MKKRFLKFRYKKKKITLQDLSMTSNLEAPSPNNFKDIIKMLLQDNEKLVHKVQKIVENTIFDKIKNFGVLRIIMKS